MASTLFSHLLLLFTVTLHRQPPLSASSSIHRPSTLFRQLPLSRPISFSADETPATDFEVTRPIPLPTTKSCSYVVLQHEFGYTYGKPPVLAGYRPPSDCPSQNFAKIILEWTATCKGIQFDRIFGVWVGGVEILRGCTGEPQATGIIWKVQKDITRYHSLLMRDQTLAVHLGNIVDITYTGVYRVNLTFHFYPSHCEIEHIELDSRADVILPISRNLPLNDGLWFKVMNLNVESKEFKIPRNTYRAVLEVYISFHQNDEFWYTNLPNDYISSNKLIGVPGNGPFREVVIALDGFILGTISPFTVIYTGGFNPLLWTPITGIGSFDLPSYDIEVTPFLGRLLDGKTHKLEFTVTNALDVWFVDANLHLWLDRNSPETQGKLLEHHTPPLSLSSSSNFIGLDGSFITNASRSIVSIGWVKSSLGIFTTKSIQELQYNNQMVMGDDGNVQIVNQVINLNTSVETSMPPLFSLCSKSEREFRLKLVSDLVLKENGSYDSLINLTLGLGEKKEKASLFGGWRSRLKNVQKGRSYTSYDNGGAAVSEAGINDQVYYYSDDDKLCYFRNVSGSNYNILHDEESNTCRCHGCFPLLSSTNFLGFAR